MMYEMENVRRARRFAVNSFGYVITVNFNVEAAKCIYDQIKDSDDRMVYTLGVRIREQFEKMELDYLIT